MALFHKGNCEYESLASNSQFRGNLLSEYRIVHPNTFQSLVDFKETCLRLYSLVEGKGGSPYFGFTM